MRIYSSIFLGISILFSCFSCSQSTNPSSNSSITTSSSISRSVTTGTNSLAIGADVSEIIYAQNKGVVYSDTDGTTGDGMQILYNHGYKWARIRVNIDPESTNYALFTDLAYGIKSAVAAKKIGFKILIDFHYSHWWADPSNQWKPTSWSSISTLTSLESKVYSWTKSAMASFVSGGVTPDMVQVGNEITNGLLWPLGGPYKTGGSWANMTALINQGISAVKAVSSSTKIILHLDTGGSWSTTSTWISNFIANSGSWSSVDGMGFSYYPMFQGTFTNLKTVLAGMKSSYPAKSVWIAETAYYWTTNEAGYTGTEVPYDQTPAGQYTYLRALISVVNSYSNVSGIFYWGAGWSESSKWLTAPSWSNDDASCRSLFDSSGKATKGIDGL